jgi:hypothetical protein
LENPEIKQQLTPFIFLIVLRTERVADGKRRRKEYINKISCFNLDGKHQSLITTFGEKLLSAPAAFKFLYWECDK